MSSALDVVRAFVERINAQDVEGLCALMTENHVAEWRVFVDNESARAALRAG